MLKVTGRSSRALFENIDHNPNRCDSNRKIRVGDPATIRKLSGDKARRTGPTTSKYVDAEGSRITAKGFTDKALTEQLSAKLEGSRWIAGGGSTKLDASFL